MIVKTPKRISFTAFKPCLQKLIYYYHKQTTMKKVFLLSAVALSGFAAFAQKTHITNGRTALTPVSGTRFATGTPAARTTATGDTLILANTTSSDTETIYYAGTTSDSGYVTGTDAYGDMGYAERYDFNTADSSLDIIGVVALFGGTVNPASTKTVTFYTWNVGSAVSAGFTSGDVYESGFPNVALDSVTEPLTALGIAPSGSPDTFKSFLFTTPTGYLHTSFFVGYAINYNYAALGGDTIGLFNTLDGERTSAIYNAISATDTVINNQSVTMYNDGTWHDNATDNYFLQNDYYIYPIVVVHNSLGVNSVTKNGITFYGNFPNPAANNTNIQFSIATATDVTITITDMAGRTINTIQQNNLTAGQHIVPVNTSDLSAGDYLYIIRTANGSGMASKMTISK